MKRRRLPVAAAAMAIGSLPTATGGAWLGRPQNSESYCFCFTCTFPSPLRPDNQYEPICLSMFTVSPALKFSAVDASDTCCQT